MAALLSITTNQTRVKNMAEDIASLAIRIDSLEARNAERDLRNLEGQGRRTARSTDVMGAAFRSLGVALAGVSFAALSRDMLRTIEQVQNMDIRLKGLTKSASDYVSVQADLSRISEQHHKNIITLSEAYAGLLSIEKTGVIVRQQSLAILEGMSNAQSKTGATTEALKQSALGLNQALSMGVVQWEEIKQVTEPIPGLLNNIANAAGYTGKTAIGAFKGVVSEGKVTSDLFGRIMVESLQQYQGAAEAAGQTLTAQYADISNAWTNLASVIESPVSDVITPVLNAISGAISGVAQDLRELKAVKDAIFGDSKGGGFGFSLPSARLQDATGSGASGSWEDGGASGAWGSSKKESESIRKEIEATSGTHTKAAKAHKAASKEIATGMSEEQKAAEQLASAYQNLEESLRKQLALSKLTDNKQAALEYDLEAGSLSRLTQEKKLHLLQMQAEIDNNELTKTLNESKKTELKQLTDEYNRLTLSARDYYRTQLDLAGIKGKDQEPLLKQFDTNTAAEANQKLIADNSAALQAYADEVDDTSSSMERLSATTSDVFSTSLGGINQLTGAMDAMVDSIKQSSDEFTALTKKLADIEEHKPNLIDSNAKKEWENYTKAREAGEKQLANLQQQTIGNYIDGVSTMAGAVAAMYDENSNEAKAFNIIAIAGLAAKAATAMLTQGQGDPYTAFARIAAMGALVSGIVAAGGGGAFSWGGSGGGAAAPKGTTGTGTVLGDKEATSNSINATHDLLKSIHAEEYAELRGINSGVSKLADGITNTVTRLFQAGGLKLANIDTSEKMSGIGGAIQMGSGIGRLDPISNFILKGLFGTTTKSVVGSGITFGGNRIGEDAGGYQYSTIETKKKSWFSSKTTYSQAISALDEGTREALTDVFKNMGDVMSDVAASIGSIIGKDVGKRVKEYMIPAMTVELHGLSGEEAAKKLNAAISSTLDTMSEVVFGDIIGQYQKLGEGMLETAIRIVSEVAVVKDALNQSGIKIAGNAIALSDSLVQAAGGLEEFQQQFNDFYDKFFSSAEKQSRLQDRLNETFREVYLLLPRTREEYRKVIDSLNVNNALDRERYSLMLQLSSAADQYYTSIETGSSTATQTQQQQYDQQIQWLRITGDEVNAVALERQREYEAMDASLVPMQKIIDSYGDLVNKLNDSYNAAADLLTSTFTKFYQLAKSLNAYSESLKDSALTTESPEQKYLNNKAEFDALKDVIKSGPGKTKEGKEEYRLALEKLQGVSQDFLESSRGYNASSESYAADFNSVIQTLDTGAKKAGNVATNAEEQLEALNAMVTGIGSVDLSIINLDGTIGRVDVSVGYVEDAVKGVTGALVAMNKLEADRIAVDASAKTAEDQSAAERAAADKLYREEQARLDAEALSQQQHTAFNSIVGKSDVNAMQWLARDSGASEADAQAWGKSWGDWAQAMIGTFDPNTSLANLGKISVLMDDFRKYLLASARGVPYSHDGAYYAEQFASLKGHANGLGFVPYDNYMARLHQGEKVVTAFDARKNETEMKQIYNDILTELKIANRQRAAGNTEMIKKTDKLIDSNEAQTRSIRRIAV